jgi:hypothetical protein
MNPEVRNKENVRKTMGRRKQRMNPEVRNKENF